ncbi:MAG: hypothetical protein JST85_31080 [Acidobacteria bacterium]|nr:hypothetical protein [Acidobacteriota bacterium]
MTGQSKIDRLCLVTAVDVEFKAATGLLGQSVFSSGPGFKICRGIFGDRNVTVLQCGMGAPGFAKWLSVHLQSNHYDALVVAGLAGGLDPRLKTGDVVVYDCCLDARESVNDSCPEPGVQSEVSVMQYARRQDNLVRALLDALRAASLNSFYGSGITVSQIVINAENKLWLGQQHQALAVDMESFDVLQVAAKFEIPAAVIRIISDEAEHDLPDFNFAAEDDGTINHRRMAAAMLQRPVASARFLRNLNSVFSALRKSLEVVLRV